MLVRRAKALCAFFACLIVLTACGSGGGSGAASTSIDSIKGRGPITFATGKDNSNIVQEIIDKWNGKHPDQKVRMISLPESADAQRQQMIQNAQTKSDAYTVLNLDTVWTSEFAANQWITQLPKKALPLDEYLDATVESVKYRDKLYAAPYTADGALLYYRKDLLNKVGAQPPQTWADMKRVCDKVLALPGTKDMSCYAGQFEKYEGLTVSFAEAVNSAGGSIIGENGKPTVNSPEAKRGLQFLVKGFKSGMIPREAITYKEETSRRAFETGKLVFLRNWPYVYSLANDPASSKVAGKFGVAPIPGLKGKGVSSLGGHNLAISAFGKNKQTALDFIKFFTAAEQQRKNLVEASLAPTLKGLYDDPKLQKQYPYLPVLKKSIANAEPRPQAVRYGEVTNAIQAETYAALTGAKSTDRALADMQRRLEKLISGK